MKNILPILITALFLCFQIKNVNGQGADVVCNGASPFCTGTTYNFPLNYDPNDPGSGQGPQGQSGPNYGCLYTQPNPVWYYIKVAQSGNIDIHIQSSPSQVDVDFICWGPFTSATGACTAQLTSGNTVDCSYSTSYQEDCNITSAVTGQFYMLLITNYANVATNVIFSQTGGTGSTDCSVMSPCSITNATAIPSACTPGPNTYSVSGSATFANAPTTGTLVITDQQTGISQTLNAPFTSPLNYNLAGLTSDGISHTIQCAFSADQFCAYNATYTAPAACNSCTAEAGNGQTVCGLTATMAAVVQPTDNNLSWSCSSVGVTFNNPNSPTAIVTVPSAGTYTFTWTITNQFGITCTDQVMIKFANIPTSSFTAPNPTCFGNNVVVTYTGNAASSATFTWNYGGGTGTTSGIGPHNVAYINSGNQNIQLSIDDAGCLSTVTTISVNIPTPLQFYVNTTAAPCINGVAIVTTTTSGGTPGVTGYTYEWNTPGNTTPPTTAGSYTATVTDANVCHHDTAFTITQPTAIVVTSSYTDLNCNGDNTGSASVSASGGTPPFSYAWSNNAALNAPSQLGLAAGGYTVTIKDANLCQIVQNFTISQPPVLNISLVSQTIVSCFGGSDGTLVTSAGGGTSPLGYIIGSLPQATGTFTGLSSGTYVVTVSDIHGCQNSVSATISQSAQLSAAISNQTNISCFGGTNGAATVTALGGTPAYQYHWTTGAVTSTIGSLTAGLKGVTVTDSKGCIDTAMLILTEPTALSALLMSQVDATCYGSCDGQAQVSASGGTSPYTWYWWTGAQGDQSNVTILCSGTHSVTLTDSHNCTTTTSLTISQPTQVDAVISNKINVSCYTGSNGQATVTASGGTPGYTYQWSAGGAITVDINTGLTAGPYRVTVTDSNNCTDTVSTVITQPTQLVASAAVSTDYHGYSISCNGLSNANIALTVSGGTMPWEYVWSNTAITQNLSNVAANFYSVIVTDANGCTAFDSTTTTEPPPLTVNVASISNFNGYEISCYGSTNGTINLNVLGGTPAYSYLWTDGSTQQSLTGVGVGQFFVTITDANGCTTYADTILTEPPALVSSYIAIPVDCYGNATGSIDVSVSGGVPSYSYMWSNSQTTEDINMLTAGIYTVTIKDINNCINIDTIQITEPPQLIISVSNDQLICSGDPTLIAVIVAGGTGAGTYQYMWDGVSMNPTISVTPLQNTTYSVYAVDANNCLSDTGHIIINILPPIVLDAYSDRDSVCLGSPVYIRANASGGDGMYTLYYLNQMVNDFPMELYPAFSQKYVFSVTDNTCINYRATDTVYIEVLPQPGVQFASDITQGCQPLTVSFHELLNDTGATYSWAFNDEGALSEVHNPTHTFESFGLYDITLNVVSRYGCQGSNTRQSMITVFPKPEARFNYTPEIISIIQPEVQFLNLSQSAVQSYWFFDDGDSSITWEPLHVFRQSGEYNLKMIAESNHGCRDTVRAPLIVKNEYTLFAPSAFSPDGDGVNDAFRVFGHGIDDENFKLTITDRWGQLIFETKNQNDVWNGKHMNIDPIVPSGVYIWMVSWQDLEHVMHQKAGWVTVIN